MAAEHSLTMNDRQFLLLSGVNQVGSFDVSEIILETSQGPLILKGEGLHITRLNLEDGGKVSIQGKINSMEYKTPNHSMKNRGRNVLGRLLK